MAVGLQKPAPHPHKDTHHEQHDFSLWQNPDFDGPGRWQHGTDRLRPLGQQRPDWHRRGCRRRRCGWQCRLWRPCRNDRWCGCRCADWQPDRPQQRSLLSRPLLIPAQATGAAPPWRHAASPGSGLGFPGKQTWSRSKAALFCLRMRPLCQHLTPSKPVNRQTMLVSIAA